MQWIRNWHLRRSARRNDLHGVGAALIAGANIDSTDKYGNAAIHLAAAAGWDDVVRFLLARDATIDLHDPSKGVSTALARAVGHGHLRTARLLLDSGASANPPTVGGITPLHWAAQSGSSAMVELLLRHRADTSVRDETTGETPEQVALAEGHQTVSKLIRSRAHASQEDGKGVGVFH